MYPEKSFEAEIPAIPASRLSTHKVDDALKGMRALIEAEFENGRERALAFTKLDECEMWLGQAVRRPAVSDPALSVGPQG